MRKILNKILYSMCCEEVKLILNRMEDCPNDFMNFQSTEIQLDPSEFKLSYTNLPWVESDRRWRTLIEAGSFSRYEYYVIRRRLRQLDIESTKQKVYEVLFK
jgi:hypothetical protein